MGFRQQSLLYIDAAGIGLCLLASLVCYVTTVEPTIRRWNATAEMRGKIEGQREKAAKLSDAIGSAKVRLAVLKQELAAGAVQFDPATQVNARITRLTAFFSSCRLQVDDVRTGQVSEGPQYDLMPITVVGKGSYEQCIRFLHGLCSGFPDMSVMQMELAGSPEQGAKPGPFRVDLFWYAAPSRSASGKPATEAASAS